MICSADSVEPVADLRARIRSTRASASGWRKVHEPGPEVLLQGPTRDPTRRAAPSVPVYSGDRARAADGITASGRGER
jgi:hypothetical protein